MRDNGEKEGGIPMLLRILLALAGANQKPSAPPPKQQKSANEQRREKDRRDYELWCMAEEYEEEGD